MPQGTNPNRRFGFDLAVDLNQRRDRRVMVSMLKPFKCLFEKRLERDISLSRRAACERNYKRQNCKRFCPGHSLPPFFVLFSWDLSAALMMSSLQCAAAANEWRH